MTTHAPMVRVPFAPLDNPRLKHLASAKNRQNGVIAQKSSNLGTKSNIAPSKPAVSKRSFDAFDDANSENVEPTTFDSPYKKSKSDMKSFNLLPTPSKTMPPPPVPSSCLSTPTRTNLSSPRAPMTAPAGRSPKRKTTGGIQKSRRISAPFSRIDPPFASRTIGSSLPFSLDAALNSTLNSSSAASTPRSHGATIQESMPKNWFFEIYEDTPEEEAANLMEHSTLTLDLSSDDESTAKERDHRGKENTPPDNYDAPAASRPATTAIPLAPMRVKKTDIIRKKIVSNDDMDDGQRSPLSDLETEPFIPEGLNKDSHVVVDGPTTSNLSSTSADLKNLFATPVNLASSRSCLLEEGSTHSTKHQRSKSSKIIDIPVVTASGELKGEIFVWEDNSSSEGNSIMTVDDSEGAENTPPDFSKI
ncbi:Hypothetical protein R9X50_00120200 [Acrodontium crateriforme]|uniref:Uncharacterized protein n=1 Tax=Acrodontium crateriforme TaxID=150365 RepID=A0AAQ3LZB8_9PEZI|nr:Hypothetical protein R9X50_00120200 [Acrodontium crateriforme]